MNATKANRLEEDFPAGKHSASTDNAFKVNWLLTMPVDHESAIV